MLTKQTFNAVAEVISAEADRYCNYGKVHEVLNRLAAQFADRFEANNPEFKRDKFLNACGIQSKKVS